jgi:hypothetical protein
MSLNARLTLLSRGHERKKKPCSLERVKVKVTLMTCTTRGSKGGESIKRRKHNRTMYSFAYFFLLVLTSLGKLDVHSLAVAAQKPSLSAGADQSSFLSATAVSESEPGTPIGPPKSIIICHRGHTIRVSSRALQQHLNHGDTLGPCSQNVVICHKYINFSDTDHRSMPSRTIIINQRDLASYLAQGDTLGPCPNQVFMCNKRNKTIVVDSANINEHLALGQTLGLCPGKNLMCHKGKTIIVDDADVPRHLSDGDCLGYCYGSAGPLIGQNTPCASNP